VAAYHVVWECVEELWLGVRRVWECVEEQWLGVRRVWECVEVQWLGVRRRTQGDCSNGSRTSTCKTCAIKPSFVSFIP